jgi:predicted amidohydrolase YtcJ
MRSSRVASPKCGTRHALSTPEARSYTAAADHGYAEAFAVSGGRLVYVGSKGGAAEWIGPAHEG